VPDIQPYEPYPVSAEEIRRAAGRIESAIQPDSDDDPRKWFALPERHREVLEHLDTLIKQARAEQTPRE
jgi:hypothetical protein